MNPATARGFCFLEQRKNGVFVSILLTYAPPSILVTLTFHCIAILMGAGTYDDASDEGSCDDDMCLSDCIKQETWESAAVLFPDMAKTLDRLSEDAYSFIGAGRSSQYRLIRRALPSANQESSFLLVCSNPNKVAHVKINCMSTTVCLLLLLLPVHISSIRLTNFRASSLLISSFMVCGSLIRFQSIDRRGSYPH
jgi:hypothetical protein